MAMGTVTAPRALQADARVAAALRVPPRSPVSAITILRLVDGEAFARHTIWGRRSLIARLAAEDLQTNDVITIAQDRLGHRLDHSEMEISALNAGAQLARALGIAQGAAVMCLAIVGFDANGKPLLFSEFLARGDRFRYPMTMGR